MQLIKKYYAKSKIYLYTHIHRHIYIYRRDAIDSRQAETRESEWLLELSDGLSCPMLLMIHMEYTSFRPTVHSVTIAY